MPGCFLGIKYGSYKITICRNCAAEGEKNGKLPKRKYAQYKTTNRIFLPEAACRQNASLFFKNRLTFRAAAAIIIELSAIRQPRGGVAHLGERLNGIQEVRGSIPLISTTKRPRLLPRPFCCFRFFCRVRPMRAGFTRWRWCTAAWRAARSRAGCQTPPEARPGPRPAWRARARPSHTGWGSS